MQLKPVEEQVVVLMGASSGIGRESALRFARRGPKVVVSARGEEGLTSLVDEIRREGGDGRGRRHLGLRAGEGRCRPGGGGVRQARHVGAPRRRGAVRHLRADAPRGVREGHRGEPDGSGLRGDCSAAAPQAGGIEAKRTFPFHSAYGASEHGIDGFLEALRVELKHEGWPISVTQVLPGTINTPFFDKGRTKLGVKPVGIPPIYEPETVANVIVYASENPARDLVSGGAARALILNQRLFPRMLDAVLTTRAGFSPQKADEPRSEQDPDNLYAPIRGHDTARNGFRALPRSLYNWLEMHPTARRGAVAGTALGSWAVLRSRV